MTMSLSHGTLGMYPSSISALTHPGPHRLDAIPKLVGHPGANLRRIAALLRTGTVREELIPALAGGMIRFGDNLQPSAGRVVFGPFCLIGGEGDR
jgi:hypothetical protein